MDKNQENSSLDMSDDEFYWHTKEEVNFTA